MRVTAIALSCAVMGVAHAGINEVVPGDYASTPGTGLFVGPLASTARTYQLLIHESLMTDLVGTDLTGLSWRIPSNATGDWPGVDATFSSYDIYLSQSVDPSMRSLTFADNVVGAQTQVRSGALTIDAGDHPSGSSPNGFGSPIEFSSGYTYTGGNLLVEIRHSGHNTTSRSVDALNTSTPGYGTLFSAAWASGNTATSGLQGNFAIVQFSAIPSPSAGAILGLGLLAGARRRR